MDKHIEFLYGHHVTVKQKGQVQIKMCDNNGRDIEQRTFGTRYMEKRRQQVRFSERGNHTLQKECENGDNDNDQKIYAYIALMYGNHEITSKYFGDSSQLTNCILDSGETCHMTPQFSDFISGSL